MGSQARSPAAHIMLDTSASNPLPSPMMLGGSNIAAEVPSRSLTHTLSRTPTHTHSPTRAHTHTGQGTPTAAAPHMSPLAITASGLPVLSPMAPTLKLVRQDSYLAFVQSAVEACEHTHTRTVTHPATHTLLAAIAGADVPRLTRALIASAEPQLVNARDEGGVTLLMRVMQVPDPCVSAAMCSLLATYGCDVAATDKYGRTAMHWAAVLGGSERIAALVAAGALVNAQCVAGETPLHVAARHACIAAISPLLDAGADVDIVSKRFQTVWDVAGQTSADGSEGERGTSVAEHALWPATRRLCVRADADTPARKHGVRALLAKHRPHLKTLILHHTDCLEHVTRPGHQEAPERVQVVLSRLEEMSSVPKHEYRLCGDETPSDASILPGRGASPVHIPLVSDEQVLRAHSELYWKLLLALDRHVRRHDLSVPFTPHVQRVIKRVKDTTKPPEHSDTTFSSGSLRAARRAAGAVCAAVDAVVSGHSRHAFCCVRPPGHHAGVNGLMTDFASSQSCGFCILNNVAIGALHALASHPSRVRRVAIIDIDIHHGNGTEEIVRRWAEAHVGDPIETRQSLFFFSTHLHDIERSSKPEGTGSDGDAAVLQHHASPRRTRQRTGALPDRSRLRGARDTDGADAGEASDAVSSSQLPGDHASPDRDAHTSTSAELRKRPSHRSTGSRRRSNGRSSRASVDTSVGAAHTALTVTQDTSAVMTNLRSPLGSPFRIRAAVVSHVLHPRGSEAAGGSTAAAADANGKGETRKRPRLDLPSDLSEQAAVVHPHGDELSANMDPKAVPQAAAPSSAEVSAGNERDGVAASKPGEEVSDAETAESVEAAASSNDAGSKPTLEDADPSVYVSEGGVSLTPRRVFLHAAPTPAHAAEDRVHRAGHTWASAARQPLAPLEGAALTSPRGPGDMKPANPAFPAASPRPWSAVPSQPQAAPPATQAHPPEIAWSAPQNVSGASGGVEPVLPFQQSDGSAELFAGRPVPGCPPRTAAAEVEKEDDIIYSFYPGTGSDDCIEANVFNAPIGPLWRERREMRNRNRMVRRAEHGRYAVRRVILERLLPALRAFTPDLIIVSAGFDGGAHDIGNSKNDGRATPGMNLAPEDFAWITNQILNVARVTCPGRVVCVLEGGYGRWKRVETAPDISVGETTTVDVSGSGEVPVAGATRNFTFERDNLAENAVAMIAALSDNGVTPEFFSGSDTAVAGVPSDE